MRTKSFKISSIMFLGFLVCFVLTGLAAAKSSEVSVLEVAGKVSSASGEAVENAVVKAVGTDVSAVITDSSGKYRFYLVDQKDFFTLRIHKDGQVAKLSQPINPVNADGKVTFDCVLVSAEQRKIEIEMTNFMPGVRISGRVTGLTSESASSHKVLVYVLTDKWYIHPYAENKDGRGYASIGTDGKWKIRTVSRGHSPFKLAMVVVPKNYMPPLQVSFGEDPDQSLLSKISEGVVAYKIIAAPEGL